MSKLPSSPLIPAHRRVASVLPGLLLLAGLGLRLLWLNAPLMRTHHWNEGHYACSTRNFSRYGFLDQRNDLGRDRSFSPLVPLLIYPTARLAGWSPWGFRLPLAAIGVGALGIMYRLMRRRWGCPLPVALAGLSVAAGAPGIVYYARNIQLDGVAMAALLAALWLVSSKKRRVRPWGWAAWAVCVLAKTSFVAAAPAVLLARVAARPGDWRRGWAWLGAGAALGLGVLPIVVWQAWGGVADPGTASEFLFRSREWGWAAVSRALAATPDFFVRDFGWPALALAGLGVLGLLGRRRRLSLRRCGAPAAMGLFWAVFIFTHPTAYQANRYYIYPALFVLSVLAGWGLVLLASQLPLGRFGLPLVCLLLLFYHGWLYPEQYGRVRLKGAALATARRGGDPFAGVRLLAALPLSRPILVDYPSTMFYAGGDPARVQCAYGAVAGRFDPSDFGAVALSLFEEEGRGEEAKLVRRLKELGWREVAPRVWAEPARR